MPVTDEPNVLEGLSFVTPQWGKGGIMLAYQPTHGKNQSELEKSLSWRFGHQRSETFSRVAELRLHKKLRSYTKRIKNLLFLSVQSRDRPVFVTFFGAKS